MPQRFRCELISWRRVYQLARRLALNISNARFQPDIIVAIARGGYVPARILCDFLNVYRLASVSVMHYAAGARQLDRARLGASLDTDISGLKVLVVDDTSDTGDTLGLVLEHIKTLNPASVNVAVLHYKKVSAVAPDFFAQKVVKWRWIIYPWAVIEDITGFIQGMADRPGTPERAAVRLKRDYGVQIPKQILSDVYTLLRS